MIYLIQSRGESDAMSVEIEQLIDEIKYMHKKHDYRHQCIEVSSTIFEKSSNNLYEFAPATQRSTIPVGSIEFVHKYLKTIYGINYMHPIEIPDCLRLSHLLLRDYKIVEYNDIPKEGEYFIKDVSQLKTMTYCGDMRSLPKDAMNKTHLYQVSNVLDIMAEYRVIVIDNKIYGIQFYDGEPTIMPTPKEIDKIKEMTIRYSIDKHCPMAYAMDVAVTKTEDEQGRNLALIEICPTVSCGLYGCRGSFLPRMYELGFQWYVEHNVPIPLT